MRLFSSVLLATFLAAGCGDESTEPVAAPERDRSMEHPPITPGAPGLEPRHLGRQTLCGNLTRFCALFDGRPACWHHGEAPAFVGEASGADLLACDVRTLCVHVPPDRVECGEITLPVDALRDLWVREGSVCLRDAAGVRCWLLYPAFDPEAAQAHTDAIDVLRSERSTCVLRADGLTCEPTIEMGEMPALRHLDGNLGRCGIDPQRRHVWCWGDEPPARVAALDGADAVVVGETRICARASGRVRCVGREERETVHDAGLEGVVEIAMAAYQACARTRDGTLHCWDWGTGGSEPVEIAPPSP